MDVNTHLTSYISELRELPVETIVRAAREIRNTGDLYARPDTKIWFWPSLPIRAELAALTEYPQLANLYVFHADGRLREAALKCLDELPDGPFAFAALTYRLNDWVEQVRDAARGCAKRLFPHISANTIAEASFFLFTQTHLWGRWGPRDRQILEAVVYRRDVMQVFGDLLMRRRSGRIGTILRLALSKPGLDDALPRLAHEAALPHVRAIAFETLIFRRAQWQVGHRYEWIDKRYGLRRRLPRLERRPLIHQLDIEELIAEAAQDGSAVVRKVAARGLIDLRQELSPEMIQVGELLSTDKSMTVRSRAEFYLTNLRAN